MIIDAWVQHPTLKHAQDLSSIRFGVGMVRKRPKKKYR